jgi:hypothetical protein
MKVNGADKGVDLVVAETWILMEDETMLDKVIAGLESKKQQQSVADERFIREQRILDELAPRVWKEVRQALESECKAHPEYLTFEIQPEPLVQIRCSNRRILEVEHLAAARTIAYRCGEIGGECVIGLEGNRAAIFDADGKVIPSANYLADQLLTVALQRS